MTGLGTEGINCYEDVLLPMLVLFSFFETFLITNVTQFIGV